MGQFGGNRVDDATVGYHELRYERFVTKPVEKIARVLAFLTEPWEPPVAKFDGQPDDFDRVRQTTGKESPTLRRLATPLTTARVGVWKRVVPAETWKAVRLELVRRGEGRWDSAWDLFTRSDGESVVSACQVDGIRHPRVMYRMRDDGRSELFVPDETDRMTRHKYETLYQRNGAIYIVSNEVFSVRAAAVFTDTGDLRDAVGAIGQRRRSWRSLDCPRTHRIWTCEDGIVLTNRRTLYLPIETKHRELLGKTLLAARAVDRGWRVFLGGIEMHTHMAEIFTPGLLIRNRGYRIADLCEESIIYPDAEDYCERNLRFDTLMPHVRAVSDADANDIRERYSRFLLVRRNFSSTNTTGIEALLLDRPVVNFVPESDSEFVNQADAISVYVANADEFLEVVPPWRRAEDERVRAHVTAGRSALREYIDNVAPPLAADRILDVIDGIDVPETGTSLHTLWPVCGAMMNVRSWSSRREVSKKVRGGD